MRDQMKALDDFEMGDLWEQVRQRTPRPETPESRGPIRKRLGGLAVLAASLALIALIVSALGPLGRKAAPSEAPVGPALPLEAKVSATIALGASPSSIAAGAGSVWVAAPDTSAPLGHDSVIRIDPSNNKIVARIDIPGSYGSVSDVAADASGVWVTAADRRTDQTLILTTFPIDPATNNLGSPIDGVGSQLAVDGSTLWAMSAGSDGTPTSIIKLDGQTGAVVSQAALGGVGTDIVLGDGAVWVPLTTERGNVGQIAQIDAATGQLVRTVAFPSASGTFETPVAANSLLWIPVCCVDNEISLYTVDASSGAALGHPTTINDGLPFGFAYGNIVAMSERGSLSAIDPATGHLDDLARSAWPATHTSTIFDPGTSAVWVANYQDSVTRIDVRPLDRPSPSPMAAACTTGPDATSSQLVGEHTATYRDSVLDKPGKPAPSLFRYGSDVLQRFLAAPVAAGAPVDGWRMLGTDLRTVTYAAPDPKSETQWWLVGFMLEGTRWRTTDFEEVTRISSQPCVPLSFAAADGWYDETYTHKPGSSDPSQAWTSNVPFASGVRPPAFPDLSTLADGQVLVLAWEVQQGSPDPTNPNFPIVQGPVQLAEPSTGGYEGTPPNIAQSQMLAQVDGRYIQVEVYVGSENPSSDLKAAAQSALDRLVVTPSTTPSSLVDELANTSWTLSSIDGRPWPIHGMHRVSLAIGTLHRASLGGYNGCNEYGAHWAISAPDLMLNRPQRLHVTRYGQTLRDCGGKSGWIEKRFTKVLQSDPTATLETNELWLASQEGVMIFSPS